MRPIRKNGMRRVIPYSLTTAGTGRVSAAARRRPLPARWFFSIIRLIKTFALEEDSATAADQSFQLRLATCGAFPERLIGHVLVGLKEVLTGRASVVVVGH